MHVHLLHLRRRHAAERGPANTCARCLRARVDITEGVPRHAAVVYCPACSSYLQPPRSWLRAAPESPELMQILLRRVHRQIARLGAAIAAAEFVFTEPHSKRLKLRLRVRREVLHGFTMEQDHVVEFTVHDRLCDACGRAQADPDQWSAVVQVRQRASHRRTLLHLEQLLVMHGAVASAFHVDGRRLYRGRRGGGSPTAPGRWGRVGRRRPPPWQQGG